MSTNDTLRGLLADVLFLLNQPRTKIDTRQLLISRVEHALATLAEPVSADPMSMLDLRVEARKASPWGEHADRTGAFVKGALWHAMLNGGAVAERDAQAGEVKP